MSYNRVELLKQGYLTKSIVKSFRYCHKRCKIRYVDGEREEQAHVAMVGTDFHNFAKAFHIVLEEEWDDFQKRIDYWGYVQSKGELSQNIFTYLKSLAPDFESARMNHLVENFLEFCTKYYMGYCYNTDDPKKYMIPVEQEYEIKSKPSKKVGTLDRISLVPKTDKYYIMEYKSIKSMKDLSKLRKELSFQYILAQDSPYASQITHWAVYNPLLNQVMYEPIKKISITWMHKTINGWDDKRGHHIGFWEAYEMMIDEEKWDLYWDTCKHKFLDPTRCVFCGYNDRCWK